MAKQTRDQKLAAKLRAEQGDSYQSASDRAARATCDPDASAAQVYDQIRDTPASRDRRASAKTPDSVGRWRRSVSPKWNG